jgi:hypothetical protein
MRWGTLQSVDKFSKTPSFPRKAGIQMGDVNPVFLDSRGNDGKIELVDGLGNPLAKRGEKV